jgi:hypothetical protein
MVTQTLPHRLAAAAVMTVLWATPAGFREAPAFLGVFTPPRAPVGTYATYVSASELERALKEVRGLAGLPADWAVQALPPFDAFGQSGGYDRWKLARLYRSRRARVARGPRLVDGRVVEAWTLISPYPDARLERLEPGTLLIVLRVPGPSLVEGR